MAWYPDLTNDTMVAHGDHVRAIGWLSADQPFPRGEVSVEFTARLKEFIRLANRSSELLWFPAFGGPHTCELCDNNTDSRNFGVPANDRLYVAPGMILHYVEEHNYKPPDEFVAAALASPLPDAPEYATAVAEFCRMHEQWWKSEIEQQRIG
jgi:hypothetical protein